MTPAEKTATDTIARLLATIRQLDDRLNRVTTVLLDHEKRLEALEKPARQKLIMPLGAQFDA